MTISRFCLLTLVALTTIACFRETGVEIFPVTGTRNSDQNDENLSVGTDATGRYGDFVLSNASIQVVLHGDKGSPRRDLFLPKSYGAIVDFSTQYEAFGSRELRNRNDDGLNQLAQGVNFNVNNPVGYDSVVVNQIDPRNAELVLTGGVYDLDGSLAAAGAPVDSEGRVAGLEVVTTYALTDLPPEDPDDEEETTRDPIAYLTMTSVIRNTGAVDLPVFSIHDISAVTQESYDVFVPYPDWGYEAGDGDAYANYVHFQPRQIYTTQYGYFSFVEEVLRVRRDVSTDGTNDLVYVGKSAPGRTSLAPGDELTFIRNILAMNSGSSQVTSRLANDVGYDRLVEQLVQNTAPRNPYKDLGYFSMTLVSNDARDGRVWFSYEQDEHYPTEYFDGSAWVPLEEGRRFPIVGTGPAVGNADSTVTAFFVPRGRVVVSAAMTNSEPVFEDRRQIQVIDENNEPVFDNNGDPVIEDRFFLVSTEVDVEDLDAALAQNLGLIEIGEYHEVRNLSAVDVDNRFLMARVSILPTDGRSFSTGQLADRTQGPYAYIDSPVADTPVYFPDGHFELLISRGPLYNVNIVPLEIEAPPRSDDENSGENNEDEEDEEIGFELGRALSFDGWLSADFDVRTSGDPLGLVQESSLLWWAYAEDLDVVFFNDTNNRPEPTELFEAQARALGSFDNEDSEDEIDSLFDELAFARGSATVGKVDDSYPDRGRFALLNLPDVEEVPDYEVPLIESDPAEWYDRAREIADDIVIQVTRPRAPRGIETGLFTVIAEMSGLAEGTPIPVDNPFLTKTAATGSPTTWLDFDLLHLLSGNRYDEYLLARADWFNILNAGIFKPVTGGSTGFQTSDLPIGAVRTFIPVSDTTLRDIDLTEFWENAVAGRGFVTNGPLIEASIGNASYGQTAEISGATATLQVTVRAAPWIPVKELRVIVNGDRAQTKRLDLNSTKTERFVETIELELPADRDRHWVVIEAGASLSELAAGVGESGTFGRVSIGHLPIAFTNPIFIQQ